MHPVGYSHEHGLDPPFLVTLRSLHANSWQDIIAEQRALPLGVVLQTVPHLIWKT